MTRLQRLRQLCLLSAPSFLALVACSAPAEIDLVLTNDTDQSFLVETVGADAQRLGAVGPHSTVVFERAQAWKGRKLILKPANGKPVVGTFTNAEPGCGCGKQADLSLPAQVRADGTLAIGEPREAS